MTSPRRQLLQDRRDELKEVARDFGATLWVTGSVARNEEAELGERPERPSASDIDLYVEGFALSGDYPVDVLQANSFIRRIRAILHPFEVDAYPLPGRVIGAAALEAFKRDALSLDDLH